ARPSSWMPSHASTFIYALLWCGDHGHARRRQDGTPAWGNRVTLSIGKRGRQAWESAISLRLADRSQAMPRVKGQFDVKRSMEPACDLGDGVEAMHVRFEKTF